MILKSIFIFSLCVVFSTAAWQNDPNCGIKGPALNNAARIIGGHNAGKHEFPWMVLLKLEDLPFTFSCGASILSSRWILTAAHCLDRITGYVKNLRILAGAYNKSDFTEPSRVVRKAERLFYNTNFTDTTLDSDVGLIKLSEDLPLSDPKAQIGAICLPQNTEPLDAHVGESAIASGWGTNDTDDSVDKPYAPDILQTVNLTVIEQSRCVNAYANANALDITTNMICADTPGKDTCTGDSGGPFMLFNEAKQRWYQYGVVSWGYTPCATPGLGTVYSRVTELLPWIIETIEKH